MKINYKYSFIILLLINLSFGAYLIPCILTDKQILLPAEKNYRTSNIISLKSTLKGINKDSLSIRFPYNSYLESSNFQDAKSIQKDLLFLDSLVGDKMMVRGIISVILTDSLYNHSFSSTDNSNLDSLNYRLQWAEKFKFYGEADKMSENQLLFQSIYDFWLRKISKNLSEYSENNTKAKFNFQYRYLTAKCNEKRYNVSVKVSSLEKVIQNILGNNWAHLFEASWNQASLMQKIIISILLITTLVCYVFTFKNFISSKK
ncbi:hypothetical protein U8695_07405 [Aquirufa antheringensis]